LTLVFQFTICGISVIALATAIFQTGVWKGRFESLTERVEKNQHNIGEAFDKIDEEGRELSGIKINIENIKSDILEIKKDVKEIIKNGKER